MGVPKMISEPMVRSSQIVHLGCGKINTISKWTETSLHLTNVTYKFHWICSNDFQAYCMFSAQTVHLSCVEIDTISKQTKTSFRLTHIT
jgi:hypothetical protein